jgi:hypothetical protein
MYIGTDYGKEIAREVATQAPGEAFIATERLYYNS